MKHVQEAKQQGDQTLCFGLMVGQRAGGGAGGAKGEWPGRGNKQDSHLL